MKLKLNKVRIAFPRIFTPEQVNGQGDPKFSAAFLIAPKDPQITAIKEAISAAATEKWGAKAPDMLKQLQAAGKLCLHNGDTKPDTEGYLGNFFINAGNKVRPLVVNKDKSILSEADGVVYGGCYVNCTLELWAQDNKFGKRVNATLTGVQFHSDGDAFVGGASANPDDFDDLSNTGDGEPAAASAPSAAAGLF